MAPKESALDPASILPSVEAKSTARGRGKPETHRLASASFQSDETNSNLYLYESCKAIWRRRKMPLRLGTLKEKKGRKKRNLRNCRDQKFRDARFSIFKRSETKSTSLPAAIQKGNKISGFQLISSLKKKKKKKRKKNGGGKSGFRCHACERTAVCALNMIQQRRNNYK